MDSLILPAVSKHYGEQAVLDNFECTLPKGKTICLCGQSGCGKTTLLRLISGLETDDENKTVKPDIKISMVFQDDNLLPWLTAADNITLVNESADAEKYLNDMELHSVGEKYPDELSGGMRRRVSIARAFAFGGELFLLDEPFKGLDWQTKLPILQLTAKNLRDKTAVFVTHDLREGASLADEVWIMSGTPLKKEEVISLPVPPSQRNADCIKDYYLMLCERTGIM